MITALAYRNVLENLSATTVGANASDRWFKFVDQLFLPFEENDGTVSITSPLTRVIQRYASRPGLSLSLLKATAKNLF